MQGLFGLAHGGLLGTGWGQGRPEVTPLAHSDYIITSLGEEIGLVGLFAILCLYMVFVSRGIRIGLAPIEDFSYPLCAAFGVPAVAALLPARRNP
jgi:cell division protein FtsW (lipid II flippase)